MSINSYSTNADFFAVILILNFIRRLHCPNSRIQVIEMSINSYSTNAYFFVIILILNFIQRLHFPNSRIVIQVIGVFNVGFLIQNR